MEKQNQILTSTQTNLPSLSKAEIIIKEQENKESTIAEISSRLLRIAKLYQIPNFDELSSVLLAEDILERYKFESLKVVLKCLDTPPNTGQKNWRLTPDTIAEWMAIEMEREAVYREQVNQMYKQKESDFKAHQDISEEVNQLIEDYKNRLKEGFVPVAPLTEKEIRQEGQTRPKKREYCAPAADYVSEWEEKMRQFQYRSIKERHPEWSEEQILARLKELERTLWPNNGAENQRN